MVSSSCRLSNKVRGYNLPPVQQRLSRAESSLTLRGFLQDRRSTNTMSDVERIEDSGSQRKRIAVACGRCRQRKIRCSGDNGTGEACTNCKSAGADPCQFLRVSSQEVQGVRPANFTYNGALSRKLANRHPAISPTLSGSSTPYAQTVMATVGHDDGNDQQQHEMPYGCVQKQYDQVHGWVHGYSGDHGVDYASSQSTLPMNEQLYMMGSYRSGHPMVVRGNVVYVDADASPYGYGNGGTAANLDARSTPLPDPSAHSFQNAMSCYPGAAMDHVVRCMPISAERPRSGSSNAEGLTNHQSPHLPQGVEGASILDMNGSYQGYDDGGTCNGSSMGRGSGMYTTTAPSDELLVHGGSLRTSMPDYAYRYAETASERGGQASGGGDMMTMDDAQYFPQGRGCYVGETGLRPTNNGVGDSRSASLAGLQG